MKRNHVIPDADIQLAVIEGTPVKALCGEVFTATVQVGTSGSAADPTAGLCARCDRIRSLEREYAKVWPVFVEARERCRELLTLIELEKALSNSAPLREEVAV